MTAPHARPASSGDPVADLRQLLERIAREFGSIASLDDAEGRLLLAKQLALHGAWIGDVLAVTPQATEPAIVQMLGDGEGRILSVLTDDGRLWRWAGHDDFVEWPVRLVPAGGSPESPRSEVG
jgi:hypothetical protein